MPDVIVSLTTVPSRVNFLGEMIESINRQTVTPTRVEINIPHEYKRRSLGKVDVKKIPQDFTVFSCDDFGPATKILPTAQRRKGADVRIIYCDDDRIYDRNWIKRLIGMSEQFPESVICEDLTSARAFIFRRDHPRKDLAYRLKRLASLGLYKPERVTSDARDAIAEGFGGVLVKPSFFTGQAFRIPEQSWAVDDVWLSANYAWSKIPIRKTTREKYEKSKPITAEGQDLGLRKDSLQFALVDGKDRREINYQAVIQAQQELGVWR